MKRFERTIIAFAICAMLIIGGIPVNSACVSAATSDIAHPGNVKAGNQSLLVEGKITEGKVQLSVNMDDSKILQEYNKDDLTFQWYVGPTEDTMKKVSNNQSNTYELTSGEDACIQVQVSHKGILSELFSTVSSRIIEVKDASAEVDLLAGVSGTDASGSGKKDGKITGTTYDMLFYNGTDINSGAVGGGHDITGLAAGQYRVGYTGTALSETVLKNGFYAIYTISDGVQNPSSPAPSVSPEPTETPGTTTSPTKTPGTTASPTKTPGTTASPTKTPGTTTSPTKTPVSSQEPGKSPVPTQSTVPSKKPNMKKAGTKTTVGNVVYKSTGKNTVSYEGMKNSSKKSVTVPDKVKVNGKNYPVTELSGGAFAGSNVQKVKLGKNVRKIGKGAFKNCKKLKKVTFPSKMQTLGSEAFSGCVKLGSVSLPSAVKTVGAKAFKNCKSMKKITLGKKAAKVKSGRIMYGGIGRKKVTIGASALENCVNLRSVIINSQVTKIGKSTFRNCKKLASILVKSLKLKRVENKALKGVNHCKISVPTVRLKKYRTLFKNKGQGKKVVIAKS